METPATSVASTATMIAPKRAVMIDDPTRAIIHLAGTDRDVLAQPSQAARAKRGQRRRTKSEPVDLTVPEKAPVTCSACRMTYLPSAIPPDSTTHGNWACDICHQNLG